MDGALTVTPRSITISTDNASRVYGADNPTSFAGGKATGGMGLVNSGPTQDKISNVNVSIDGLTYGKTKNIGSYAGAIGINGATILNQAGQDMTGNYTITYAPGTLEITPRPLTITANPYSRVYGEANPLSSLLGYTIGATDMTANTGLVNGDTVSGVTVSLDGAITSTSDAKTYTGALTPGSAVFGSGSSSNYAITYNKGDFTITPRPVYITAGNTSRIYGDDNNAGFSDFTAESATGNPSRGLLTGDSITSVINSYADAMNRYTHAGEYRNVITPGSYQFSSTVGGKASNYDFIPVKGKLTINPRPLTITGGNISRYYGDANPLVTDFLAQTGSTGSGSGLVNGDKLASVSSVIKDMYDQYYHAGEYTGAVDPQSHVFAPGVNPGDYAVTYAPGTLTIAKAPLTITAEDKSRMVYVDNPELTVRYSGFKNGENASVLATLPTVITQANRDSLPGKYVITPGGANGDNYVITYVDGVLTVMPNNSAKDVQTVQSKLTPTQPSLPGKQPSVPGLPDISFDSGTPPVNSVVIPTLPPGLKGEVSITAGGSSSQRTFVTDNGGFSLRLNGAPTSDEREPGGTSRTSGAVPVLYAGSGEQRLDGIYIINYNPNKLSLLPAAQKVTIPRLDELSPDVDKTFSMVYRTESAGSFEVTFGNGIVAIYPLDETALTTVTSQSKEAGKAVLATGILTAVEDLGVMPDQIRAVYLFTEIKR